MHPLTQTVIAVVGTVAVFASIHHGIRGVVFLAARLLTALLAKTRIRNLFAIRKVRIQLVTRHPRLSAQRHIHDAQSKKRAADYDGESDYPKNRRPLAETYSHAVAIVSMDEGD